MVMVVDIMKNHELGTGSRFIDDPQSTCHMVVKTGDRKERDHTYL